MIKIPQGHMVQAISKKFKLIIERSAGIYTFHSFFKRFVIQDGLRRFNLNYQTGPDDLKGISSPLYRTKISYLIGIQEES